MNQGEQLAEGETRAPRALKTDVVAVLQTSSQKLEFKRVHALERIACFVDLHEAVGRRELEQVTLPKTKRGAENIEEGADIA